MADGDVQSFQALVVESVVYVSDHEPGIRRRRAGKGYVYRDASGAVVRDSETLERIRKLAIPPAWTEVWISPDPRGHIQAVGRDAKGRKQYIYHAGWSAERSAAKYARAAAFGRALPQIRERTEADLSKRGLTREKVLATVVRLLELTLIRVGNREYARTNRSYGLTTLTKRHLELEGSALVLHFRGKSGIERRIGVRDRRLARLLRNFQELPGQHLFKYPDAEGELVPIESADVNDYLREVAGDGFSAKDFRTWAATVSAARALRAEPPPRSKTEAKRTIARCCRAVSGLLGNTPSVCRASYIHPAVLEAYAEGLLADALPEPEDETFEPALIAFLEEAVEAAAAETATIERARAAS
jgi:DNA topoisomerase-1